MFTLTLVKGTGMYAAVCIRQPCQVVMLNEMLLTVQLPSLKWYATSDMRCINDSTTILLRNHVAMGSV